MRARAPIENGATARLRGPERAVIVSANTITMCAGEQTGVSDWYGDGQVFSNGNLFHGNAYHTAGDGTFWTWSGASLDWAGRQGAGQDTDGTWTTDATCP